MCAELPYWARKASSLSFTVVVYSLRAVPNKNFRILVPINKKLLSTSVVQGSISAVLANFPHNFPTKVLI
jgi:hypothetical protein